MQRDSSILMNIAGAQLKFPWAGGHNFTNWGTMDLDGDGFKDLVVYDKSGGKVRTYINDKQAGTVSFTHSPYYQDNWPALNSWMALHDYNCDGKEDIFTYSGYGGILVYRNISTPGNFAFVKTGFWDSSLSVYYLVSDYTPVGVSGTFNIPVNQVGLPGISDLDGDGDLDIITFNAQGYNIEYHQNQSKELGFNCDSLIFKVIDDCWGDISESSCAVNMNICPFPKIVHEIAQTYKTGIRHAGSCLMCFDADGDTLTDVLLGDIVCDSVLYLHNGGFANNAHIDSNTPVYPPAQPISINIFPCTYYLDLNNDSKRDLIAAPALQGSENVNNTWIYTNGNADNSPVFTYQKNNFLQENMIDLGEGAYPTLFDYEGDGDLDMLAGNLGYFASPFYVSKIALFKNIGSATVPSFSLVTDDVSNLSSIGMTNMSPATGDLDGDGDPDLLVGDNNGRFSFFPNSAGVGNPAVFASTATANYGNGFLQLMDVGLRATPQLIDLDKDGRLDLIAGNHLGKVFYYRNIGTTTAPSFTLVTNSLGGVNVYQPLCNSNGNSFPFVFSDNGSYRMLVGSECGNLFLYDNIDGNLAGNFNLVSTNTFGILEGARTAPVLGDLTGDSRLDLVIGNYSGGLGFYRGLSTNFGIPEERVLNDWDVYPNPSTGSLHVVFNAFNSKEKNIRLTDISGRIVKQFDTRGNKAELELGGLSNGVYFLAVELSCVNSGPSTIGVKKIILAHE